MKKIDKTIQKHGLSVKASRRLTNTFIYIFLISISIIWKKKACL